MHEMSIIEALLETVRDELRAHPGARVQTARIRVGQLRQVEPEMLEFAYNAAVRDTPLADSRLEIDRVEASACCDACRLEFPVEENWFECPRCRSTDVRLLRGDELLLTSLDIEDNPLTDRETTNSHVHCH
jgi:hydrogenase nickel incorporation protein HypA/HybF